MSATGDNNSDSDNAAKPHSEPIEDSRLDGDAHGTAEKGWVATNGHGEPLVHFDKQAERKLRRKIDWAVVPMVSLLYLFCFIDRANVGNARLAGLETDLGMVGNDYNALLSIFYISYILFEIPANVACKLVGPAWFIPAISLGFGISSIGTAFVQDLPAAMGVRFILGVFESGMMPCITYYLSRWYRRAELTFRLSLFIVTAPLAGAFGGLLASAILTLDHFGSLQRWRMIFAIEGIITIGLSIIAFFVMTDRPETAGWLTPEEKELAVARVKSERVAQTTLLDKIDRKKLWLGFWNPMVLTNALVFLLNNITVQGLAFFAPTIVSTIYPMASTVTKQLYTVPPYAVGAVFEIFLPLLSWRYDRRQIFIVLTAPLTMLGYILFLASSDPKVRYAATFFTAISCFAVGPLVNAQASGSVVSDTSRTISLATNMMGGNIGGLIATWSYLSWDQPDYRIGNGLNLASSSLILILATLALMWMKWDNKRRERRDPGRELEGLTTTQIESLEWKHPEFRWRP